MKTTLLLLLACPFALAAPIPKDRKKGEASIVGTWKANLPAEAWHSTLPDETWIFDEKGQLKIESTLTGHRAEKYTYKCEPNQTPARFEFCYAEDYRTAGIYKIEGDQLTIALPYGNDPPPTAFDDGKSRIMTFKRVQSK